MRGSRRVPGSATSTSAPSSSCISASSASWVVFESARLCFAAVDPGEVRGLAVDALVVARAREIAASRTFHLITRAPQIGELAGAERRSHRAVPARPR